MIKIFDELKYAIDLFKHGPKKFMNGYDLCVLSKYFRHIGKSEKETREELENYCKKFYDTFNSVIYADKLDWAVKSTKNYGLRIPVDVPITRNELEVIKGFKNQKYQKILFKMLVLAKYYELTNTCLVKKEKRDDDPYYVNEKFCTIIKIAHTSLDKKSRDLVKHELKEMDMFIAVGENSYMLSFANRNDPSEVSILVSDMENLISFLPFWCENCGIKIEKRNSNRRHLCFECNKKQRKEKVKNYVIKYSSPKNIVIN